MVQRELVIQCLQATTQRLCCPSLVTTAVRQRRLDQRPLRLRKRRTTTHLFCDARQQVVRITRRRLYRQHLQIQQNIAQNERTLDSVLQLSDIAWPCMTNEHFERALREFLLRLAALVQAIQKMVCQQQNIVAAVTQRWNENRKYR